MLSLLLGLVLSVAHGYAQQLTGQIRGSITDSSGAFVPSATVTIINVDRNQTVRTVQSSADGEYVAPQLPAATIPFR